MICNYKYKKLESIFIINFESETANVLEIKTDVPISRNLSFRYKDKLIKILSKNDIKLNIESYLNEIDKFKNVKH